MLYISLYWFFDEQKIAQCIHKYAYRVYLQEHGTDFLTILSNLDKMWKYGQVLLWRCLWPPRKVQQKMFYFTVFQSQYIFIAKCNKKRSNARTDKIWIAFSKFTKHICAVNRWFLYKFIDRARETTILNRIENAVVNQILRLSQVFFFSQKFKSDHDWLIDSPWQTSTNKI